MASQGQEQELRTADGVGVPRVQHLVDEALAADIENAQIDPVIEVQTKAPHGMIMLRNKDAQDKHIWEPHNGRQHTLLPFESRAFLIAIARQFLNTHPRYVCIQTKTQIHIRAGERTAWIANVTGNPLAAAMLQITRRENGADMQVDVPNPHKKPATLSFKLTRDQLYFGPDDDRRCVNTPPVYVSLPPYERVELPAPLADTLLNRSMFVSDLNSRAKVQTCRKPSDFEPNVTWPLKDVRLYANMMAPSIFTREKLDELAPPSAVGVEEDEHERTDNLLKCLFFFLIDDRFSLPTADGFERRKLEAEERTRVMVGLAEGKTVVAPGVADAGG